MENEYALDFKDWPTEECPFKESVFVNTSHDWVVKKRALIKEDMDAYLLLLFLVEKMDRNNSLICSMPELQEELSGKENKVVFALDLLKGFGFIFFEKKGNNYSIRVNPDVAYKG